MTRFDDKIAVVVGGASGMGLATAIAFAAEGARVVITGRDRQALDAALEQIGPPGDAIRNDIASLTSITALMAEIGASHGRIDVLFFNAGMGIFKPLAEVGETEWDQVLGVNLKAAAFCAQQALPWIPAGGAIVFCGSVGHQKAMIGNSAYAASKAGLRALTRVLALEMIERGIRVNCLSPGPIDTPIMDKSTGYDPKAAAELRAMMANAVPMKRLGRPSEIASAVLFLASDAASFITGADLPVDGGLMNL